jgi:hypothetical protein
MCALKDGRRHTSGPGVYQAAADIGKQHGVSVNNLSVKEYFIL